MVHERFMRRCLQLARCGMLGAPPNPMVGAVLVASDGRILGEGFHARCGEGHAEVNAFASVRREDEPLLAGATLYVSLEPCSHQGRTPPCAALIIRKGVRKVVVGCRDPFPRVSGRGLQMLREAGVEVTEGVLEDECLALNAPFITAQTLHRPYIILKWARSADGFLDAWRSEGEEEIQSSSFQVFKPQGEVFKPSDENQKASKENQMPSNENQKASEETQAASEESHMAEGSAPDGGPVRISSAVSTLHCHHLRARAGAVLVGHNTLTLDRPRLDVRHWGLPPGAAGPLRIVLGRTAEGELPSGFEAAVDVEDLLLDLTRRGVQTLLVEGGTHTLQTFIDQGLWDEAHEEINPHLLLAAGVPCPRLPFGTPMSFKRFGGHVFHIWKND